MTEGVTAIDIGDRRIFWACCQYWSTEPLPPDQRVICFSWVKRTYRTRFGVELTRAEFDRVARSGLLQKAENARGGDRRYYRICDVGSVTHVLAEFDVKYRYF